MKYLLKFKIFENKSINTKLTKKITLYHGSPYKFNSFKPQDDLSYNTSGHLMSGISFTDSVERAKLFADIYPIEYYDDLRKLKSSFSGNDIDSILIKVNNIKALSKIGNPEDIEIEIEKLIRRLVSNYEKTKESFSWLDDYNLAKKFENQNKYSLRELESLKGKLTKSKRLSKYTINSNEDKIISEYNLKLSELENKYVNEYGFIYTCEIIYNELHIGNGEYIGFGSTREEILNNLPSGNLLKIEDSDTGQYIGTEFIVPDYSIKNIKIKKIEKY